MVVEVYAAFEGVTREGGVSWSQAYAIDMNADAAEYEKAGREDRDSSWTEVLQNEAWAPGGLSGGFIFLDAIGFRYYLPAAMIRELNEVESTSIERRLNLPPKGAKGRKFCIEKWQMLSDRQRRCVAKFILFAIERELAADQANTDLLTEFELAWENYWSEFAAE